MHIEDIHFSLFHTEKISASLQYWAVCGLRWGWAPGLSDRAWNSSYKSDRNIGLALPVPQPGVPCPISCYLSHPTTVAPHSLWGQPGWHPGASTWAWQSPAAGLGGALLQNERVDAALVAHLMASCVRSGCCLLGFMQLDRRVVAQLRQTMRIRADLRRCFYETEMECTGCNTTVEQQKPPHVHFSFSLSLFHNFSVLFLTSYTPSWTSWVQLLHQSCTKIASSYLPCSALVYPTKYLKSYNHRVHSAVPPQSWSCCPVPCLLWVRGGKQNSQPWCEDAEMGHHWGQETLLCCGLCKWPHENS